ncbi:MAG: outer rane biosis protein BamB [Gemmataceae bacterium]|nr:outer rane biosis protein BamB [Gemmataceae bacterium]
MRFSLSLAAATLLLTTARPADNWPEFRGPNGDGTADAKAIPTEWSETKNVRWKTAIHGKGWSSPVVWGDQVWMTTADEVRGAKTAPVPRTGGAKGAVERVTFFAVCADRNTGKISHDIKLAVEDNPAFCIDFNSYASPTPVVEDGRLYAHFGSHGTWCVDTASGKVLWERKDLKCDHFRGPGSSPVVYKNLLVLIFDGFDQQYVAALDKSTGQTVWKKDRNIKYATDNGDYKKAYATARVLEVNGKPQLICPSAECTIAYDPVTGEELWRFHHLKKSTMNVGARPVAGHGLVYLVSGHPSQLMALKEGVSGMVPKDAVAWETDKGVPTRPSLLVQGDLLFMVSDGGVVSCLDAKTGKPFWSERLNGEYTASPVLVGGHIYLPNQTGKTTVIKAAREYEPVAANELDAGCMASPAVAGDALILRTKTHLYSIGKK